MDHVSVEWEAVLLKKYVEEHANLCIIEFPHCLYHNNIYVYKCRLCICQYHLECLGNADKKMGWTLRVSFNDFNSINSKIND